MNDYKSITQIAAELGVTRQAVYKKIKSNSELSTSLQEFTVNQGKFTVYSLQGQWLIKQAFLSPESVNCKPSTDSKPKVVDSKLVDTLQKTVEALTKQLEVKDNQINTLTETVKELTIALKAAQALHGMDKQQKTIEVKAAPSRSEQPRPKGTTISSAQDKPKKKLSFRDKLRAAADIFRK